MEAEELEEYDERINDAFAELEKKYSNLKRLSIPTNEIYDELTKIKRSSEYADKIGLEVHAGHGMDYKTTKILSKINEIKEFNIGHFIIGESIFD